MWETIKKYVTKIDTVILVLTVFNLSMLNYSQLNWFNKIYLVSIVVWFVVFGAKVYNDYKKFGGKGKRVFRRVK